VTFHEITPQAILDAFKSPREFDEHMVEAQIGRRILERLVDELAEVATPETMPRMEGNQMHTILTGKQASRKS